MSRRFLCCFFFWVLVLVLPMVGRASSRHGFGNAKKGSMLHMLAGVAHHLQSERTFGRSVPHAVLELFVSGASDYLKSEEGIAAMQREILNPSKHEGVSEEPPSSESGQLRLVLVELEAFRSPEKLTTSESSLTTNQHSQRPTTKGVPDRRIIDVTERLKLAAESGSGVANRSDLARSIGETIARLLRGTEKVSALGLGTWFLLEGKGYIDELVQAGRLTTDDVATIQPLIDALAPIPYVKRNDLFGEKSKETAAPVEPKGEGKIQYEIREINKLKSSGVPNVTRTKLPIRVGKLLQELSAGGSAIRIEPPETVGRRLFDLEEGYLQELVRTKQLDEAHRSLLSPLVSSYVEVFGTRDLSKDIAELEQRVEIYNSALDSGERAIRRGSIRDTVNAILRQLDVPGLFHDRHLYAVQIVKDPSAGVSALVEEGKLPKKFAQTMAPVIELLSTMQSRSTDRTQIPGRPLPVEKMDGIIDQIAGQILASTQLTGDALDEQRAAIAFRIGKMLPEMGAKVVQLEGHNETSLGLHLMNQPDQALKELLSKGVLDYGQALKLGPIAIALGAVWPPEKPQSTLPLIDIASIADTSNEKNGHEGNDAMAIVSQASNGVGYKRRRRKKSEMMLDPKIEQSRIMKILTGQTTPFDP